MLKVDFASDAPRLGHRGMGTWAGLLSRFDNGQKLCTIREILDFLQDEVQQLSVRKRDEFVVSDITVRKAVARICSAENQIVENGRVYSQYLVADVREFGRQIKMGKRFTLDPAEKID